MKTQANTKKYSKESDLLLKCKKVDEMDKFYFGIWAVECDEDQVSNHYIYIANSLKDTANFNDVDIFAGSVKGVGDEDKMDYVVDFLKDLTANFKKTRFDFYYTDLMGHEYMVYVKNGKSAKVVKEFPEFFEGMLE